MPERHDTQTVRSAAAAYRTASAKADHARAWLYEVIREDRKAGVSLGELAKLTGLSRSRIQQIESE